MYVKFYLNEKLKFKTILLFLLSFFISFLYWVFSFNNEVISLSEDKGIKLPIVMYHLVLKNLSSKNKFIISESMFEQDLKYINENGYTTILVKDLIDYVEGKSNLPEKPILLTFDDGAYNNYLYAFPLAKKYNCKFVFSPICKEVEKYSQISDENPSYAHANWNHIKEMSESGIIEIQNHTYDMHKNKKERLGCSKKSYESIDEYKMKLLEDINKAQNLIEEKTRIRPTGFFYPFGACSKCSDEIVKSLGFKATFLCYDKLNYIKQDSNCLFKLNRFLRNPDIPTEKFFKTFEK